MQIRGSHLCVPLFQYYNWDQNGIKGLTSFLRADQGIKVTSKPQKS